MWRAAETCLYLLQCNCIFIPAGWLKRCAFFLAVLCDPAACLRAAHSRSASISPGHANKRKWQADLSAKLPYLGTGALGFVSKK